MNNTASLAKLDWNLGTSNNLSVTYNFDYSKQFYVTGLPLIPSIGIKGEF